MQIVDLEFIVVQIQENLDLDPMYWNEDEGCIKFDETPVFYKRFDDHFMVEIDGVELEVPRI